jgi:hypothetical protein
VISQEYDLLIAEEERIKLASFKDTTSEESSKDSGSGSESSDDIHSDAKSGSNSDRISSLHILGPSRVKYSSTNTSSTITGNQNYCESPSQSEYSIYDNRSAPSSNGSGSLPAHSVMSEIGLGNLGASQDLSSFRFITGDPPITRRPSSPFSNNRNSEFRPASPHESARHSIVFAHTQRPNSPAGSSTRASIISTDGESYAEDRAGSMADSEGEPLSSDAGLGGVLGGTKVHALRKRRKSSRLKSIVSVHQSLECISSTMSLNESGTASLNASGRRKPSLRPTRLVVNKDKVVDVEGSNFPSSPLASSIFSGNQSEHEVNVNFVLIC